MRIVIWVQSRAKPYVLTTHKKRSAYDVAKLVEETRKLLDAGKHNFVSFAADDQSVILRRADITAVEVCRK